MTLDDVMQSARSIFIASLDRLSPETRKSIVQSWALTCNKSSSHSLYSLTHISFFYFYFLLLFLLSIYLTLGSVSVQDHSEASYKSKPLAVLVLAIFGCEHRECLTPEYVNLRYILFIQLRSIESKNFVLLIGFFFGGEFVFRIVAQVTNELADMLQQDSKLNITIIELFGKGFELWAPRIFFSTLSLSTLSCFCVWM
jgi:hypothetical protein